MAGFFSQSRRNYEPLDDRDDIDANLPLNYIINDNADDELDDDDDNGRFSFSRIVILMKTLKIPRINFAYFSIRFRRIPKKSRRTCLDLFICLFCMFSMLAICSGLGYHALFVLKPAPVIDKSYRAFRIPNHEASLNYGALQTAKKNHTSFSRLDMNRVSWLYHLQRSGRGVKNNIGDTKLVGRQSRLYSDLMQNILKRRKRRSLVRRRRSAEWSQYYPAWKMQVIFMTEKGENIFTKERLHQIHNIEKKILAHEKFSEFCYKDGQVKNDPAVKAINGCAPLNSLLSYFFPSKDKTGKVFYDGLGDNMDNVDSALRFALTTNHFYYYVDDKVNSSNMRSQFLRTEVLFGAPLKGYGTPYTKRSEQSQKFKDFVITYIDILSKSSTKDVSVLYGGQEIFDYEVEQTFWNDVKLAIYAFVAIFLLMLILTSGSIWLTFWGLVSILLSAPLAIFFYHVAFKIVGLGILNGAAAFVIIGIGVDDVFVFINIFRQADHVTDPRERTWYTIKTAGKATFFTSFTTAAAFAANIASMIPAVHDFGLFMSLIVANCWITVMLIMPPVLYIWYISFRKCEAAIARVICCCLPSSMCSKLTLPSDVAHFMDNNHSNQVSIPRETTVDDEDDDDVPMLTMEDSPFYV
ncbi:protein dispatched homolog 3-like, partial [Ruditapes philippinarum]|uniref:protein dispatched homolog 3-like n=1 Tax=Ruditapes philippinarum TaxID=129788 RepID=UPI00295B9E7A